MRKEETVLHYQSAIKEKKVKLKELKKKIEANPGVLSNYRNEWRLLWALQNDQENLAKHLFGTKEKIKYLFDALETLELIYVYYEEVEDWDSCEDVVARMYMYRYQIYQSEYIEAEDLKKIIFSCIEDIAGRADMVSEVNTYQVLQKSISKLLELDSEAKVMNREILEQLNEDMIPVQKSLDMTGGFGAAQEVFERVLRDVLGWK